MTSGAMTIATVKSMVLQMAIIVEGEHSEHLPMGNPLNTDQAEHTAGISITAISDIAMQTKTLDLLTWCASTKAALNPIPVAVSNNPHSMTASMASDRCMRYSFLDKKISIV